MLLDWAAPLKRAGIDIIAGNPILQKAAMAVFPWMDDAANMVVFGDSRGGSANFQTFENLLAYYAGITDKADMEKVASALNKGISQKNILEIMPVGQGCVPIQLLFHLCVQRTMSVPLILLIIVSSQ